MIFVHAKDEKQQLEDYNPPQQHYPYNEEETYLENWSSWNNNGHIGGQHRSRLNQLKHIRDHPPVELMEDGVYMKDGQGEDIVGFTYPPQYAEEIPDNNIETYMEDTYRRGLHTESGHLITRDQDNFYDVNQDEADLTDHDYYHEEHENRDVHGHHRYDKEIGHEDRVGQHASHRKYFVIQMIPPKVKRGPIKHLYNSRFF